MNILPIICTALTLLVFILFGLLLYCRGEYRWEVQRREKEYKNARTFESDLHIRTLERDDARNQVRKLSSELDSVVPELDKYRSHISALNDDLSNLP